MINWIFLKATLKFCTTNNLFHTVVKRFDMRMTWPKFKLKAKCIRGCIATTNGAIEAVHKVLLRKKPYNVLFFSPVAKSEG